MKRISFLAALFIAVGLLFSSPDVVLAKTVLQKSNPALERGMKGDSVKQLQQRLLELGHYTGEVSGTFNSKTFLAVYNFQLINDLKATGVADDVTVEKLNLPDEKLLNTPPEEMVRKNEVVKGKGSVGGLEFVKQAKSFLGTPYVWGGTKPGGFDCSGFIYYLAVQRGVSIPRTADIQFNVGTPIDRNSLQAGDLVFFSTYEPGPSHVGIYMGDGNFIHASSAGKGVIITSLSKTYYVERYLGARRLSV